MLATHLHLALNHLPIVATFLALPLLALSLWFREEKGVLLGAVSVLVLAGIGAVGAKWTGEEAEEAVEELPGVSERWIHEHEERAETATIGAVVVAVAAIGVGIFAVRTGTAPSMGLAALMFTTTLSAGAMAWTGLAGGRVHHPEIRPSSGEDEAEQADGEGEKTRKERRKERRRKKAESEAAEGEEAQEEEASGEKPAAKEPVAKEPAEAQPAEEGDEPKPAVTPKGIHGQEGGTVPGGKAGG